MRIGFAGLAHSHPHSDAANAVTLGASISGVSDPDPERRRAFAHRFGCPERESVAALCADRPELIIATPHPSDLVRTAAAVLAAGIPAFFNKVVAATPRQLDAWEQVVASAPAGTIGTASVLRFAPAVAELRRRTLGAEILAVRVIAQHDNAPFQTARQCWQDDPSVGGGTLVTVGVHAWELVDTLLPGGVLTAASGWVRRRAGSATLSEDAAGVTGRLTFADRPPVPVQATVTGLPGPDRYAIELLTADGIRGVELDVSGPNHNLGFAGLVEQLLTRAGRVPVDWRVGRTVVGNTIRAAQAARA